ncbi:MAG: trypsin-like peptidase domain-containing protein [Chloroflexi bacterium]|nr:trypsin-like peptidase domain-containing protein [Chloroflexota bacterium]
MSRSNSFLISCAILLAVLVGIVGGGIVGGFAGYFAAQSAAPAPVAIPASPILSTNPGAPAPIINTAPTNPPAPPAVTNLTLKEDSAVIEAVRKVKPAVVTVINQLQTRRTTGNPTASGSGVVVDPRGYIVTNNHVIEGQKSLIVVFSDGTKADATIIGTDSIADIAVLKIEGKVPAVAQFGDSSALEPGQWAIAIGSPLGDFRGTVTVGVVSALNRQVARMQGLIQTDAAINNGNSGGPLINSLGQVIGINTLVVRSTGEGNVAEGLGFAVPSNMVREIVAQLLTKGKVERAYIGIRYSEVDPTIASTLNLNVTNGVVIGSVEANSPAEKSGLKENDVILAMDATRIDADHPLAVLLFTRKAGETVTLTILRDGKEMQVKLTLTVRPPGS